MIILVVTYNNIFFLEICLYVKDKIFYITIFNLVVKKYEYFYLCIKYEIYEIINQNGNKSNKKEEKSDKIKIKN